MLNPNSSSNVLSQLMNGMVKASHIVNPNDIFKGVDYLPPQQPHVNMFNNPMMAQPNLLQGFNLGNLQLNPQQQSLLNDLLMQPNLMN